MFYCSTLATTTGLYVLFIVGRDITLNIILAYYHYLAAEVQTKMGMAENTFFTAFQQTLCLVIPFHPAKHTLQRAIYEAI